jgi:hypothetical protein
LVALYWIRPFKPLLAAGLPQTRNNVGLEGLGFVREGFRQLADVSHLDLRIGISFSRDRSVAFHAALRDAAGLIARMPAHHTTYSNDAPVFPVRRVDRLPNPTTITLNADYLGSFGEMRIPPHLWRALQRYEVWIEPALVTEWIRLMQFYADRQGRRIEHAYVAAAMAWSDPSRDVKIARDQAIRLLTSESLHCVWTGRLLSTSSLDIDHCFPWSAWPCDDLWNLLPTHRSVNQRQKRDRLADVGLLHSAKGRIEEWWQKGYLSPGSQSLRERFMTEARATLPILREEVSLDDVFAAVCLQQMRLKHDQQVPVWEPLVA